ncbi:TIGR03560 family F420-dependent LLM class oxidoreductase [Herbidospora sp. NEAU-GS84]|uniref:TIGR03560 family F420-dependent LLM class oxidoreductase n=1 Tax=Herbidospora solisilvae TaxID=2696284 RepID=A0A7C9MZW1_9ACTN|nr:MULTISPECIES: LLM class F420-dependent oxidoreductase [Herbidospora]NAS21629.1 TIGR03560 family F420-dependent LLM class oxidoreductase [Herbidospora solisilvae]GLX94374.1 LLM class F420-dependent oxidoreductase [Herbidospora sp. NBRC 101105]
MKLRIFTEPQEGATYDDLLAVAQATERLGFDAFFRSDHYQAIGSGDPGPGSTDAWLTLAGLARETATIRLGTLVTPATFRLPGPLAISVAQADQMSGGRIELGLGTGWYDAEHHSYGIPFPPVKERFDRLEEQLAIITGLWAAEKPFSYAGTHYRLTDSPALPKPVQNPLPIIIGGFGATRTPRLAATYAAEYNIPFRSLDDVAEGFARVRAASAETGRSLIYSVAQTVCVGADEAEVARRAAAIGESPEQLRSGGLAGTPEEVVDKIGRFGELGAERVYLQVMDLSDLDHLDLIAREVMPHV